MNAEQLKRISAALGLPRGDKRGLRRLFRVYCSCEDLGLSKEGCRKAETIATLPDNGVGLYVDMVNLAYRRGWVNVVPREPKHRTIWLCHSCYDQFMKLEEVHAKREEE